MSLSKSKYTTFCQCDKALWMNTYQPDDAEEDPSVLERLAQGARVGELARNIFGPYEDATVKTTDGSTLDYGAMVRRTQQLIQAGVENIAEAAFSWNGNYCAVDILFKTPTGYAIYEVKSSTYKGEKENTIAKLLPYLQDVAYQKYVLEQSGISVSGTYLVRLDSSYVRGVNLDLQQLFNITDLAPLLTDESVKVPNNIAAALHMLQSKSAPATEMGRQCKNPHACAFLNYCTRQLMEQSGQDSVTLGRTTVFNLYRMTLAKKVELVRQGKVTLDQLNDEDAHSIVQQIQVNNYLFGEDHIERDKIKEFLDTQIRYPLYFLDFETVQYAIPQFPDSHAYQQIPFQYSLHYILEPGGKLLHKEFLGDGVHDPRRALAEQLVADIPLGACTTAYNKSFECSRIKELAQIFPDLSHHLMDICDHIVDFLDPFRAGYFYKSGMRGSFSIKKVLPALFPDDPSLDYHNLTGGVQNGGEAMNIYPKMKDMTPEERLSTRKALLEYCCLDTFAMVKLWEKLVEESNK